MKSSKCLLIIFFTLSIFGVKSQKTFLDLRNDSTKLYIEYTVYDGYLNDSIFTSVRKGDLYIGKKGSVYIYQTESVENFIQKLGESIENENLKKIVAEGFRSDSNFKKDLSRVFIKLNDSENCLEKKKVNNIDMWLSDTVSYHFKPENEFKTVASYRCQKAIGKNLNGSEVVVWFTEDIPITSGPLNVYGLPGLILEVYSPQRKIFYKAVAITSDQIPDQQFRSWLSGPIITKADYVKLYNGDVKKMEQLKQMIQIENSRKQ